MLQVNGTQDLFDLAIIGAGPAGLTAAIYAHRANVKCCVIEASAPGGKMLKTGAVENYPGVKAVTGPDLGLAMFEQVSALGVPIVYAAAKTIEKQGQYFLIYLANNKTVFAKAVIVAVGTIERPMQTPNEARFYSKGISYCAICDGPLYKNQDVAVVGGGLAAVEEALFLADIARKVYLVHRRDEFRADAPAVARLRERTNVEFILSHVPHEVRGDKRVAQFVVKSVKDGSLRTLDVACIFPYIGATPATGFLKALNVLDANGYLAPDATTKTSIPGLFGAGDCISKRFRQIATAVSDGTVAALSAKEYLSHLT